MKFLEQQEYAPHTDELFETMRERLVKVLPFAEVEHIGSSAIFGAISKGDLDILVRVHGDKFHSAIEKIETLGFSVKVGTLRTKSLCMLEATGFDADVAIQLIEKGSEFEDFAHFRDRLNSDVNLVERHNELKRRCQGMTPSEYRTIKSVFIEEVLKMN